MGQIRMTRKVVVLGSRGQLGGVLCQLLGERAIAIDRNAIDVTVRSEVLSGLLSYRPFAVINAAAYTAVDLAEGEVKQCRAVNADAVSYIAEACEQLECPLVQISTDYVFGGDNDRCRPYREDDRPNPLSVYGFSKLEGERRTAENPRHYILRTCGLYGGHENSSRSRSFVDAMIAHRMRPEIRVVSDQRCTPSFTPHVAQAIVSLLETDAFGTYHIVNQGDTTWWTFAKEIFRLLKADVHVEPISSQQWNSRARRPLYSVLDTTKLTSLYEPLPPWQDALSAYLIRNLHQCLRQSVSK